MNIAGDYVTLKINFNKPFSEVKFILAMNWLITGGCGFIGTSLIRHLIINYPENGIRVLDNLSVGTKDDLASTTAFIERQATALNPSFKGVELVAGDIRDYNSCLSCCAGIDTLVHLAANTGVSPSVENPRQDMEANIIGTFNMLEAARLSNVKSFIFASSGAPVGEVELPITEDKAPKPVSPYGASKLAGEGYCSAYYRTYGLKTIALRFSNVYGPGSTHKNSVVAKFFRNALIKKPLEIYGDGNQTRDLLYIDDLLNALMLSALSDIGGEIFQISSQKETTVNEIASLIREIVKSKKGVEATILYGSRRTGDVIRNYSDISKARQMLGYAPRYDLKTGLIKTFEYFDGLSIAS